jgi:hypothetical protein
MLVKDEIIEIAKLAGFEMDNSCVISPQNLWYIYQEQLEAFAKLVEKRTAAKEREACESIEYDLAQSPAMFATMAEYKSYRDGVQKYREAIRARAQADGGEA